MWQALLPAIGQIFERVLPDPAARDAAQAELRRMQLSGEMAALEARVKLAQAQTEINAREAVAPDVFTRGWRPAVGWVCVAGLAYEFLARPLAAGLGATVPPLPMDDLNTLLYGLLGLGALRTVEKVKGVA